MSRVENPDLRRIWRSRIEDHDGTDGRDGGIRRWLRLAEAEGLDPDYVASGVGVLPELFAPKIHAERITGLLEHYDFATVGTIAHFRHRLSEAHKDVAFGPQWVLAHTVTTADRDAAAAALTFKTEVLWAQLDALWHGYVAPGRIPPGARVRGEGLR